MIRQETDSFVFGVDEYPNWFMVNSQTGLVKPIYSDGMLINTLIATASGFESVKKGDTIMELNGSMVIIPSNIAKEYGVEW